MPVVELTLSRWHKVQGRLQDAIREYALRAHQIYNRTSWNSLMREAYTEQQATQLAQDAKLALSLARQLITDVGVIRAAVGAANHDQGITARLARQNALSRELEVLEQLKDAPQGAVSPQVFLGIDFDKAGSTERAGRMAISYAVDLMPAEDRSQLQAEIVSIRRAIAKLADTDADANRCKVLVPLSNVAVEVAALEDHILVSQS